MKPWTPEDINQLRTLWDSGEYSARGIGVLLHRTRSAVLGKLNRLGLLKSELHGRSLHNSHKVSRPRTSWRDADIDDSDEYTAHVTMESVS